MSVNNSANARRVSFCNQTETVPQDELNLKNQTAQVAIALIFSSFAINFASNLVKLTTPKVGSICMTALGNSLLPCSEQGSTSKGSIAVGTLSAIAFYFAVDAIMRPILESTAPQLSDHAIPFDLVLWTATSLIAQWCTKLALTQRP